VTVRETDFTAEDGEHWFARYPDGLLKLYPGHYVGEEGFLYRRADSGMTAFSTFDPALMKAAMLKLYADFMAGEPPMIPEGKSACALPHPARGAEGRDLRRVTGPGAQYYGGGRRGCVSAEGLGAGVRHGRRWGFIQYRVAARCCVSATSKQAFAKPGRRTALALEAVP
jgi:hypothetical protein